MNFAKYLKAEMVHLDLRIDYTPPGEDAAMSVEARQWAQKELVLTELVSVFERSGEIRNPTKFFKDFVFREKQASTAIGRGLAIPHLRSMQTRRVVTLFARAPAGVEFVSPDNKPTFIFFGISAPPYDDTQYLQIFQWIARAFSEEEWLYDALLDADNADEALRLLRSVG